MNDSIYKERINLFVVNSQVSVAPGSKGTISAMLANQGAEEDYFELYVKGLPSEWVSLETSVISLQPGEQREIPLTIQPAEHPQGRASQYPFVIQVTSQGHPGEMAEVEGTLTVAAFQSEGRIGVLMGSTQFAVAPGSSLLIPILLLNRGLEEDVFRLHVEGIPASWVSTSAPLTRLEAGQQSEVELALQPPRAPQSEAGRHPFVIQVQSEQDPSQQAEAACILTVAAFAEFSSELFPKQLKFGQTATIVVKNLGNFQDSFSTGFHSQADALLFEKIERLQVQAAGGEQNVVTVVNGPLALHVPAGESGAIEFRAKPRSYRLFGGELAYPFTARVQSTGNTAQTLQGELTGKALVPIWILPLVAILLISVLCLFTFSGARKLDQAASATQTAQYFISQVAAATQTASFNQTQAVLIGQEDTDGDGLTNAREIEIGTDPTKADTDADELLDGDEVNSRGTDPRNPDTDGDGLSDGEEALRRGTDPRNPDSDQDGLKDGDEVQRNTDPRNPDTDQDGSPDGDEMQHKTDPRNPDTDNDRLSDGKETPPCPSPLNPDTDGDGIIDGLDLNPCDPKNPALTATAAAGLPTPTPLPPTPIPPTPIPPTPIPSTQPPTAAPTAQPTATLPSPPPPPVNGTLLFETNRDGNAEIYKYNNADQKTTRLTIDPGVDTQPAWSPDGNHVAFASNRTGNFEIYVINADGTALTNLTNNPADDRDPVWSPDGKHIAFTTNRDGNSEIYVMIPDGTGLTNLTDNPAEDSQPAWFMQPMVVLLETDWIAFTSNRDGNQEIYIMLPDGSEQVNLTNHPANDNSPVGIRSGNQIAFVSNRDGNQEIYVMDTDGQSPANLTNNPAEDQQPASSSGSPWLAFTTNRDGNQEIYLFNVDTSEVVNLSRNPAADLNPAWYGR